MRICVVVLMLSLLVPGLASADFECDDAGNCTVTGPAPNPPADPPPPPPPDTCTPGDPICDPCAFGACDPPMMAKNDPPKPKAPEKFGGVTTANFAKKADELTAKLAKIAELAKPKDPKKETLNSLLIARLFVGGTPIGFVTKLGDADAMWVQFGPTTSNDPLVRLVLDALGCKQADASCAAAQIKELEERVAEINKIKNEAMELFSNLELCAREKVCTPPEELRARVNTEVEAFNKGFVAQLLDLKDDAEKSGTLKGAIECESGEPLVLNRCLNPSENEAARNEAARRKQEEKKKSPSGI